MINRTDLKSSVWASENDEHNSLVSQVKDAYENLSNAMIEALGNELISGYGVYTAYSANSLGGQKPSDFALANHTHPQYYLIKDTVDKSTQLFKNYLPPDTLNIGDVSSYDNASYKSILCPVSHNHDSRYWKKYETVDSTKNLGGHPSSYFSKSDHTHPEYYHKRETVLRTWGVGGKKASDFALATHNHDQTYYLIDEAVENTKGLVSKDGNLFFGSDFAPHDHNHPQYMSKPEADGYALRRDDTAKDAYSLRTRLFLACKSINGDQISEPIENPLVRFIPISVVMPLTAYLPSYKEAFNADKTAASHHGSTDIYLPNMNFAEPYSAQGVADILDMKVGQPTSLPSFSQNANVDNMTTEQKKNVTNLNKNMWFKNRSSLNPKGPWKCIGIVANVSLPPREMSWWKDFWDSTKGLLGRVRPENLVYGANPYVWAVHLKDSDYWRLYAQGDFIEKKDLGLGSSVVLPPVLVSVTGVAVYIRDADSDKLPVITGCSLEKPGGSATITSPTDNCRSHSTASVTGTSEYMPCDNDYALSQDTGCSNQGNLALMK